MSDENKPKGSSTTTFIIVMKSNNNKGHGCSMTEMNTLSTNGRLDDFFNRRIVTWVLELTRTLLHYRHKRH
jgi:hypothetical protein